MAAEPNQEVVRLLASRSLALNQNHYNPFCSPSSILSASHQPPTAAELKFIWNQDKKRIGIFYGLNGREPVTEIPQSTSGLDFGKALTESTDFYILMSNGSIDIDHFEVTPTAP